MNSIAITTSQNISIYFTQATLGERCVAFGIDMIIKFAYMFLAFYLLDRSNTFDNFDSWGSMVLAFFIMIPFIFYTLILEAVFEGQTLGKYIMKIKVIKIDDYQLQFIDHLTRWIMRLVDILMMSGVVAILTIIFSNKGQRLGDMVTGTAVISIKNNNKGGQFQLDQVVEVNEYKVSFPQAVLFSDRDMQLIKKVYNQALQSKDYEIKKQLIDKICQVINIPQPNSDYDIFIQTVIKDFNYLTSQMK